MDLNKPGMARDFSLVAWGTEGPLKVDLYDN